MFRSFIVQVTLLYIIFINLIYAEIIPFTGVEYYYKPEPINSLSNRIYALEDLWIGTRVRPYNTLTFTHGGLGTSTFSQPILWNVHDYTGIYPKNDYDFKYKQIGRTSTCCTSAFQVEAGSGIDTGQFGWYMTTTYIPLSPDPLYRYVNMQANYLPYPTLKPWKSSANSKFVVEFSIKIPTSHIAYGATNYITSALGIRDSYSGKYFWVQPVIHINGFPAGTENIDGIGYDVGSNASYINPIYRNSGRYISIFDNPYTGQRGNITSTDTYNDWKWYSFFISKTHLKNMIDDLNVRGANFSNKYEDYYIEYIGIQSETSRHPNDQTHVPDGIIGFGVKQLYIYRLY